MPSLIEELAQILRQPTGHQPTDGAGLVLAPIYEALSREAGPRQVEAYGAWGSLGRLVGALVGRQLGRPVLFVTAHIPHADQAQDDLETFLSRPVQLLPAAEIHQGQGDGTSEIASERLRLCRELAANVANDTVIVAPVAALMQAVPEASFLLGHALSLAVGQTIEPDGADAGPDVAATGMDVVTRWLIDEQFARVDQVDVVGEFARRGGIVDVFGPGQDQPVRIEFFGDQIESLRYFDLDTQRSSEKVNEITIASCRGPSAAGESTHFFRYLPRETVVVLEETSELVEVGRLLLDRLDEGGQLYDIESVLAQAYGFDTVHINRFAGDSCPASAALQGQSAQRFENRGPEAIADIVQVARENEVFLFCENAAQQQRMGEMVQQQLDEAPEPGRVEGKKRGKTSQAKWPGRLHLPIGFLQQGFCLPSCNLFILSHNEVFAQHHQRRRLRRVQSVQAVESFTDLERGDYVVHVNHGIARFRGMKTLAKNGRQQEFLVLEFSDRAMIHVPADKIYLVHKYVGARGGRVPLARLGGRSWEKQKQKVAAAVEDLAAELLDIQAYRQSAPGIAYPADTAWQRELEESFPYEDTVDQASANVAIKEDMQRPNPMDRLLCGDVGFGKTELAMRAAFKTVQAGKQVAVLVPTTVLADQHYRTFTERLADFPVLVEVLSRFKTAGEARDIIARTAAGQVDILIGTHRILSEDVHFTDLGLVVIDEEQRFGVEHKERLKRMRKTVDVLTMTATPIPRTLHMALLGLRDISSLTTPPLDRRSIVTEVVSYDPERIRAAILHELARDGQVYFVHNRVQSIMGAADRLGRLAPEARIVVGHGQMPKHELEKRMLQFVNHEADVLVCTTIIESGLDIPNANTIIIDETDRFGLAELHQLRGRVGRYKNRAYAYMLLPRRRAVSPVAAKRLKAIEEYSQLGSGFRIALRDLEIRGAGNILGAQQSGHIDAVGYELYCQLLARAVRQQQGQPEPVKPTTHLELGIDARVPRSYVASERQRMDVYRRLAGCASSADLDQLRQDLVDLFGQGSRAVEELLVLAEVRLLASRHGIGSIVRKEPDLIFTVADPRSLEPVLARSSGRVSVPDGHTVHLRLGPQYFKSNATLLAVLRKLLGASAGRRVSGSAAGRSGSK